MNTSKFFKLRTAFLNSLVNNTATLYLNTFKASKPKWKYSLKDLRNFPVGSLGKELANFLDENKIDLIPKAENHDIFHWITGFDITAKDEIAMQYWLVGNGKLTPYTMGTCFIGMVVMPEFWKSYVKALKKGMKSTRISNWNFQNMLYTNADEIKAVANTDVTRSRSNSVTIESSFSTLKNQAKL